MTKLDAKQSLRLDDRSEGVLATLLPPAQDAFRKLIPAMNAWLAINAPGVTAKVISGLRTFDEQAALYAKGRTKPGPKVTNAPPGSSWHNYGLAGDVGLFRGTDYLEDSPLYEKLGAIGIAQGLDWGGAWKTSTDLPHYGVKMPYGVSEALRRHNAGESLFDSPKTVTAVVQATPRPWTVVGNGTTRTVDAAQTAGVRTATEMLGGSVNVDGATKTITITMPK